MTIEASLAKRVDHCYTALRAAELLTKETLFYAALAHAPEETSRAAVSAYADQKLAATHPDFIGIKPLPKIIWGEFIDSYDQLIDLYQFLRMNNLPLLDKQGQSTPIAEAWEDKFTGGQSIATQFRITAECQALLDNQHIAGLICRGQAGQVLQQLPPFETPRTEALINGYLRVFNQLGLLAPASLELLAHRFGRREKSGMVILRYIAKRLQGQNPRFVAIPPLANEAEIGKSIDQNIALLSQTQVFLGWNGMSEGFFQALAEKFCKNQSALMQPVVYKLLFEKTSAAIAAAEEKLAAKIEARKLAMQAAEESSAEPGPAKPALRHARKAQPGRERAPR
ncbi:MAG: hypothetical protein AB7G80_03670 [Dongiaceae bacterium]